MTVRYTPWRRAVQVGWVLVFLALPLLATPRVTGTYVALKIGSIDLVEPASALAALLAARGSGWSVALTALPLVVLAIVLGPVYCAWGCPFGLASELIDAARQRRRRSRWVGGEARALRFTRFVLLELLLAASLPFAFPLVALLAPPRLLTALPLEARAIRALPAVTATLVAIYLLVETIGPRRLVCRVLCPAGTLAALLRRRITLAPRFDRARCLCPGGGAPCFHECPWAIDPRTMGTLDGCTTCLRCVERCPSRALTVGFRPAASTALASAKRVEEALPHRRRDPEELRHRGA